MGLKVRPNDGFRVVAMSPGSLRMGTDRQVFDNRRRNILRTAKRGEMV